MADWEVTQPSRSPKYWNNGSGTYSDITITENGVEKARTAGANRTKYIEPQGPQNFGACDDREKVQNVLTNMDGYNGALAYCRSEMTPRWDWCEPGTITAKPKYELDWQIENKVSAPNANQLRSKAHGALVGTIDHTIRRKNAQAGMDYTVLMRCKMSATYTPDENANQHPSLAGYMRMVCQNSYCEAWYNPSIGPNGEWTIVRRTLQSNGQFYDRTYTHAGRSFERIFGFYPKTTGSAPLFWALEAGRGKQPWNSEWHDLYPDHKSITMVSDAGHVTGLDPSRDDKWEGYIWIQPQVDIEH